MKAKHSWPVRWRAFRLWQKRPHAVSPLSQETHECATCQTVYQGNFCPRCGQSHRIQRYSFRTALLNFFDVWGLGNRSMFRTLRDLLLRPGYMIRDYLGGMQMAYFPPFKMFFLLTTLSLVVDSGLNLRGENFMEKRQQLNITNYENSDETKGSELTEHQKEINLSMVRRLQDIVTEIAQTAKRYPNMFGLLWLTVISFPLFLMFRRAPAGHMYYSEFLVSLVYITNMFSIYSIVFTFLGFADSSLLIRLLLYLIPLKQLSGFGWWSTLVRTVVPMILVFCLIVALIVVMLAIHYFQEFGA